MPMLLNEHIVTWINRYDGSKLMAQTWDRPYNVEIVPYGRDRNTYLPIKYIQFLTPPQIIDHFVGLSRRDIEQYPEYYHRHMQLTYETTVLDTATGSTKRVRIRIFRIKPMGMFDLAEHNIPYDSSVRWFEMIRCTELVDGTPLHNIPPGGAYFYVDKLGAVPSTIPCKICGERSVGRIIVWDKSEGYTPMVLGIHACEHHITSIINEATPGEIIKVKHDEHYLDATGRF